MSTIFEATRHDSVGQVSHYINSGVDVNGEDWVSNYQAIHIAELCLILCDVRVVILL